MLFHRALGFVLAILLTSQVGAQTKADLGKFKVSNLAEEHAMVNIWPQIPFAPALVRVSVCVPVADD